MSRGISGRGVYSILAPPLLLFQATEACIKTIYMFSNSHLSDKTGITQAK